MTTKTERKLNEYLRAVAQKYQTSHVIRLLPNLKETWEENESDSDVELAEKLTESILHWNLIRLAEGQIPELEFFWYRAVKEIRGET